jgi:hypothetical protein
MNCTVMHGYTNIKSSKKCRQSKILDFYKMTTCSLLGIYISEERTAFNHLFNWLQRVTSQTTATLTLTAVLTVGRKGTNHFTGPVSNLEFCTTT